MKRPTDKAEEHDWIEQYLFGKMTKEEAVFFENELKNDKNLTKEMENVQQIHKRIQEVFLEQNALNTLKKLQALDRRRITVFKSTRSKVHNNKHLFFSFISIN